MADHSIMPRVEVLSVTDTGRRRRWTDAEKLRIVEKNCGAPRTVAATARRHENSRALPTCWRRKGWEGQLGADSDPALFAPVAAMTDPAFRPMTADTQDQPEDATRDRVEIILPNGRRLVDTATKEAAVLARLIQVSERA